MIFLFVDANENVIDGVLCSRLVDLDFTPCAHSLYDSVPNTHVEGSECIKEFWGLYSLKVMRIQLLSFHGGIGNHRPFIVNSPQGQLVAFSFTALSILTAVS